MIPIQQAGGIFTQATIAKYKEMIKAPSFLSSLFTPVTTATKYVNIEVERGNEKIAVEILRGTTGNPNDFNKSTAKQFLPKLFDENTDITELDGYDVANVEQPTKSAIVNLASDVSNKMLRMKQKIERAKELMAAQVLETGVVTAKYGENIDFKRKAASLKDNSGSPWSTATTDVEAQLVVAAEFIRIEGKNLSKVMNAIMSTTAWLALKKTDFFKDNANYNNVVLNDIKEPLLEREGASFHGTITAGSFIFNVWTYDQSYQNEAGTRVDFLDDTKVIIVPTKGTQFVYSHGGLAIGTKDGIKILKTEFAPYSYVDKRGATHTFGLKSAPLPVPVTIDMIYTMKVLA